MPMENCMQYAAIVHFHLNWIDFGNPLFMNLTQIYKKPYKKRVRISTRIQYLKIKWKLSFQPFNFDCVEYPLLCVVFRPIYNNLLDQIVPKKRMLKIKIERKRRDFRIPNNSCTFKCNVYCALTARTCVNANIHYPH